MRFEDLSRWSRPLPGIVLVLMLVGTAHADDPQRPAESKREGVQRETADGLPGDGGAQLTGGETEPESELRLTQDAQQRPLSPAPAPMQPTLSAPQAASDLSTAVFGSSRANESLLSAARQSRAGQPGTDIVLGGENQLRSTTDAGNLLRKSNSAAGVAAQNRTPIVTDTIVRGNGVGRLVGSGSYWFPARQDLDTMLSKIDSSLIGDMIVIKGPYAARYGPGFSFVDFDLTKSPRFQNGFETHGSTSANFKSNGEQWYGRQSIWGGDSDWGFRAGYGHRTGNDYETGDGTELPSSYNSRDFNFSLGFDLSPDSHIEFAYLRLDQTGVEFPGQIFDIDFLKTDSFEVRYRLENQAYFDALRFEAWDNATHFQGNAQGSGKRRQVPLLDEIGFIGLTEASNLSTGFSLALDWVGCDNERLTVGVDLRYLRQELDEVDVTTVPPAAFGFLNTPENFPIPKAYTVNPGLFVEAEMPVTSRLKVKTGGRVDWVTNDANSHVAGSLISDSSADLEEFLGGTFDQHFFLGAGFVTAEYTVCDHYTATAGGGFAMRPPTMTELYATAPFVTVMPQFATTTIFGDPGLDAEKRWQIDLGLQAKFSKFRGSVNGFYAWIDDYITLDLLGVNDGADDLPLYSYVNTDRAILAGFEASGEYDLNRFLTSFATMSYIEGRDLTRRGNNAFERFGVTTRLRSDDPRSEESLPTVSPLEARVGLRLQDPCEKRWGIEFSVRIVDDQDRVAETLLEAPTPGFTTYDLRGFWRPSGHLMLVSGVENLTDKHYREHLDSRGFSEVFQPGIGFYFGAELTY